MDYKTNILTQECKVEDAFLQEFPGLKFGTLPESDTAFFDYTAFYEFYKEEPVDYKMFMRANKFYIERAVQMTGASGSELFYQNTDGHILVDARLAFLFLAFASAEIFEYFQGLLSDVFTTGAAFSNATIYNLASSRLPSETLGEIIKSRQPHDEPADTTTE